MILPALFIKVDRDIDSVEKKLGKKVDWLYYRGNRNNTRKYSLMIYLNKFDSRMRLTKERLNMLDGSEFLASIRKQTNKVLFQTYVKLKVESIVFGEFMSARTIPARDDKEEYAKANKFLQWFIDSHSLGRTGNVPKAERFEIIMKQYDKNLRLVHPKEKNE